jgi:hypothetical protein
LFVVSYCKPLPPGKNPFAVNKYYILHIFRSDKYDYLASSFQNVRRNTCMSVCKLSVIVVLFLKKLENINRY